MPSLHEQSEAKPKRDHYDGGSPAFHPNLPHQGPARILSSGVQRWTGRPHQHWHLELQPPCQHPQPHHVLHQDSVPIRPLSAQTVSTPAPSPPTQAATPTNPAPPVSPPEPNPQPPSPTPPAATDPPPAQALLHPQNTPPQNTAATPPPPNKSTSPAVLPHPPATPKSS